MNIELIKVYIDCSNCGFKGVTYENEDLDDDEELLLEEEQEECPMCGEYAKEIEDDEIMEQFDIQMKDNAQKRKKEVIPFSLDGVENG